MTKVDKVAAAKAAAAAKVTPEATLAAELSAPTPVAPAAPTAEPTVGGTVESKVEPKVAPKLPSEVSKSLLARSKINGVERNRAKDAELQAVEAKAKGEKVQARKVEVTSAMAENEVRRRAQTARKRLEAQRVTTNFNTLPWPSDASGFLSKLKTGGVEAARRVGGDEAKLDKYMESLQILAKYAKLQFANATKKREKSTANSLAAGLRVKERDLAAAERKARDLEEMAKAIRLNAGVNPIKEASKAASE